MSVPILKPKTKSSQSAVPGAATVSLVGRSLRLLERLSPRLTARLSSWLFFSPRRFQRPQRELQYIADAQREALQVAGHQVMTYRLGSGPRKVLLVHGWEGRGSQLGAFIAPLVDAGFQVITFDAPGHGESTGRRLTPPLFLATLRALSDREGSFEAIIGHSLGSNVSTIALGHDLPIAKAILISPASSMRRAVNGFVRLFKLSAKTRQAIEQRFEKLFGNDVWRRYSGISYAPSLPHPALIIHDEDDADVDLSSVIELAGDWPQSRLMITEKLGHRRILRDPEVIEAAVTFLSAT